MRKIRLYKRKSILKIKKKILIFNITKKKLSQTEILVANNTKFVADTYRMDF